MALQLLTKHDTNHVNSSPIFCQCVTIVLSLTTEKQMRNFNELTGTQVESLWNQVSENQEMIEVMENELNINLETSTLGRQDILEELFNHLEENS